MSQVRKVPMRQCIGCREMKSKKEMIRILKTTEDEIVIDATGKKNGRGAYICPSRECFQKAVKNKGIERSLKMAIPKEVYEALEKEIEPIEAEEDPVPGRPGHKGGQDCQRRVFHGEIRQGRKSMPGDRFCREFGEHEEKIYEYVYFLQGTHVSVRNKG